MVQTLQEKSWEWWGRVEKATKRKLRYFNACAVCCNIDWKTYVKKFLYTGWFKSYGKIKQKLLLTLICKSTAVWPVYVAIFIYYCICICIIGIIFVISIMIILNICYECRRPFYSWNPTFNFKSKKVQPKSIKKSDTHIGHTGVVMYLSFFF